MLMSRHRANFTNKIGCETREVRRTWLLFFHESNPLDSLTQFAGPSAVPPCRQFTCTRIGSGNERGRGGERETSCVCKTISSSPIGERHRDSSGLGCIGNYTWHLKILLSACVFLPNLSNAVVRPCIRPMRAHAVHPTTGPGCGPYTPPNSR